MRTITIKLKLFALLLGLLACLGCGGVKDDPNITEKEAKEGANEGEGEDEDAPDVSDDTIKFKPKPRDEEGAPDDGDE